MKTKKREMMTTMMQRKVKAKEAVARTGNGDAKAGKRQGTSGVAGKRSGKRRKTRTG